jgi:hypothetical protein
MKVKLLFPPAFDAAKFSMLPHGMCVLAGHLRARGFAVAQDDLLTRLRRRNLPGLRRREFDLEAARDWRAVEGFIYRGRRDGRLAELCRRLGDLADTAGHDLIGIAVHSVFQLAFALLLARAIRERETTPIVLGGNFITLRGTEFFPGLDVVDYLIVGDGELPMQTLLAALREGRLEPRAVPGLVYRSEGAVRANAAASFPAEEMAVPDFDGLDLRLYRHAIDGRQEVVFPYQFVKGCTGRCAFCTHHVLNPALEAKSPAKVAREIGQLVERHGARCFYICDSSVNADPEALRRICDRLAEARLDIRWGSLARVDGISDELCASMRRSGCAFLRFGLESGSDRILARMGKAHRTATALDAIRTVARHQIRVAGTLIAGFPGERAEDVRATEDFVRALAPHVEELACGVCFVEPGSPMQRAPERFGMTNLRAEPWRDTDYDRYDRHPRKVFGFDEIDGVPWRRKRAEQVAAQRRIHGAIHRHVTRRHARRLLQRLLPFSLYTFLGDRKYRGALLPRLYHAINRDYYYTYSWLFAPPRRRWQ